MDAKFITNVLYKKHVNDYALHQVSTGKYYSNGIFVLDFWAIKLDWNKSDTSGYEIKVSREDFLNDSKWHNYLQYCNKFYFICPVGLIKPTEIDPMVGLIYVNEKGGLKVVKAAVFRICEVPAGIFKHILFTRLPKLNEKPLTRETLIREYIEDRASSRELGTKFKSKLVDEVNNLKNTVFEYEQKINPWKEIMDKNNPNTVKELLNQEKPKIDLTILETISILSTGELNRLKHAN